MQKFLHVYFNMIRTRFDRKGRPYEQYRDAQSFYGEFESRTENGWFVVESAGATFRFPVESIAEIVEGH